LQIIDGAHDGVKVPPQLGLHRGLRFFSRVASDAETASKTTLPLERTVFTLRNPANSKLRLSSGILALLGLTPRRKAT
jgi:hypothetical protein